MSNVSRLFEMINAKLRQNEHSELLKRLLDSFLEGESAAVEAKIREMITAIEGE